MEFPPVTSAAGPCRRLAVRLAGLMLGATGLLALASPAVAAPKTDILVFKNGDRLTGEVKSLERGKLDFKTDATGTISIEWDKVASLQSNQYLEVELSDGRRHFGRPSPEQSEGELKLRVGSGSNQREVPIADVVRMAPIEQGRFVDRLDGYVTAGYDYTKATDLHQFTFTGGLSSRDEKRQWSIDGSTTQVSQSGQDDTSRYELGALSRRFLRDRWFVQGFGGFESNDELGLDLRTTLGAAYGRFLRQDQKQDWAAYAGLAVTQENFSEQPGKESVEGVLGTQYWFYRYDSPEASFNATLNLFPSLTDAGRLRSEGRLRARYEIVSDLFFEASFYGSYDSEPGAGAESKSDYGVTTSLGYSF
jgi:putative salt-induced outer membrane protein YdiY